MDASLFILLPTADDVLNMELTEESMRKMMDPLMTVKVYARKSCISLRIFFDSDNIVRFMEDAGAVVDEGTYLKRPSTVLKSFISSCSTDLRKVSLLDGACSYVRWDTVRNEVDTDASIVVKSAFESLSATCVLSLTRGVPTDYYMVSLIKDRQYQGGLPELKNIPLFFSAVECIEWMSSLVDGHFSLIGNKDFIPTNYKWGHQTMFRRKDDGTYWYFDYFHKDNKVHYEVFNTEGYHLGEASKDGILQEGTKDSNKSISEILHGK